MSDDHDDEKPGRKARTRGADPSSPEYEVGYGKPPVANRFEAGASGNPRGRRRGPPGTAFADLTSAMLESPVATNTDGKRKRKTVLEYTVMRFKRELLTGPPRALERYIPLLERYAPKKRDSARDLRPDLSNLTDEELQIARIDQAEAGRMRVRFLNEAKHSAA